MTLQDQMNRLLDAAPDISLLAFGDLSSGLIGVPDTFPPRPLKGFSVSGFLAPNTELAYTYPDSLKIGRAHV